MKKENAKEHREILIKAVAWLSEWKVREVSWIG